MQPPAEWSGRGELEAVEAIIEAVRPTGEPGVLPSRVFRDLEGVERKWGAAPKNRTSRAFPSIPYPLVVESVVVASTSQ